jgi:hypothetical protein
MSSKQASELESVSEITTRYGRLAVPNAENDLIGRFLTKYGEWAWLETVFVASILPEGARILDGGAFVGTFGLGVAGVRDLSFAAAFVEANFSLVSILQGNVSANARCPWEVVGSMIAGTDGGAGLPRETSGNIGGTSYEPAEPEAAAGAVDATSLTVGGCEKSASSLSGMGSNVAGALPAAVSLFG